MLDALLVLSNLFAIKWLSECVDASLRMAWSAMRAPGVPAVLRWRASAVHATHGLAVLYFVLVLAVRILEIVGEWLS